MLMPMFFLFAVGYAFGSLILWILLEQITQKFHFRQQANPDEQQTAGSSYPWLASIIIAAAFVLPLIPAHPVPDIGNWEAMLGRTLMLLSSYFILSLVCWIRMAMRPSLPTLYLAITGMIMSGLSFGLLILLGAASPS